MISHRHRCIYVKVPKCASTSVHDWFMAHGGGRHSYRPAWHGGPTSRRIPAVAHAMNLYPDYFTFAFLRNPYERFVSLWLHLQRIARSRGLDSASDADGLGTLAGFAGFAAELLGDFGPCWGRDATRAFKARRGRAYGPGRIRLGDLGWSADHLWPQTAFLPDCNPERLFGVARANAAPLSFIGSVDRMEEGFARLKEELGLPGPPLQRRRASGPLDGAERTRRYLSYYDAPTRRLVETLYRSDLAFTGCGFEDGRLSVAVRRHTAAPRALSPGRSSARRPPGALLWRGLWSLSAGVEARILRLAGVRRIVHWRAARRGPG